MSGVCVMYVRYALRISDYPVIQNIRTNSHPHCYSSGFPSINNRSRRLAKLSVVIDNIMSTLATKNVAAVLAVAALVVGTTFAFARVAKADTLSDLNAQVQALLAQIASLQGGSTMGGSMSSGFTFTRDQKMGDTGGEVMEIQKFLNSHGAMVSSTGAGSPGSESSYFGSKTKSAVMKFQSANGIAPIAGYWGPKTRAVANSMNAMTGGGSTGGTFPTPTGTVTPTPTPAGLGITISSASQPVNSLAPASAVRVPFTTFTLTNNSGAEVTINGVTVQRTGLAQDVNFSSLVLVDSQGLQLGNTQTLDSNHMATIGGTFKLAAGASQTFTVAGNMAAAATIKAGEIGTLTVTGVNTSVPVAGSLPITGASQTMNATLTLGSVTTAISSLDPNSATTKNIGATGIKFTAVRFTAGSAEDLKLFSIRWRINGSASVSDLSNVTTVVNGTSYPVIASSDGRYFTSTFPGGILVQKGYSIDVYIQGDLSGSNSATRVVEFDVDKTSDVYFVGQLYGYGVAMAAGSGTVSSASTHATTYSSSQPVFQGSTVTIQAGTVTTIQNATSVAAQNIPVNVPNTVLGGFTTNFAGEPVTLSSLKFHITSVGTSTTDEITNISLVDENGSVVAGPVDASASVVTFSNSITFPVGSRTYTLKGKIPSTGWGNNDTVQFRTIPSSTSFWAGPTGQVTGNTITISTGAFTMNTMTVKAGSLALTAGSSPSSQNVVAGAQNLLMANIQFDASQSGEDVRMSSVPLRETGAADPANLSGCQLWDGTTALNTGSNVVNTVSKTTYTTFTFDNQIDFAKGTVKTLGLTCNLSSSATSSTYIWGLNSSDTFAGTGKDSANTVTPTATTGTSGTMTVSTGASLTVAIDASSPSYAVVAGGTTGVNMGVIKIRSANEAYNLQKLGLTLENGTYGSTSTGAGGSSSSGTGDLVTVYLYQGSTLLGTATFTGSSQVATSTFNTPLSIPRDTDVQITVKADLAGISVSAPGGIGNLIKVDPLNVEGTGAQSGTTVRANATAGVAGARLFKSYPTFALDTLSSTGIADGKLIHFKVTADSHGPVGIGQMQFTLSTTTLSVTNIALYAFTDSAYSTPVSGQGSGGQIGSTQTGAVSGTAFNIAPSATPLQVPAGQTYYFELRGSVSGSASGASVVTTLAGDSAYTTGLTSGYNVATSGHATSTSSDNFTWSGLSTTTPSSTAGFINEVDWSNGYGITGLPSGGMIQTRSN